MRESKLYRPGGQGTFKYSLLVALAFGFLSGWSQSPCEGSYQEVLIIDSTFRVPCHNMVLMNLPTFSHYYYGRKNYDTLRQTIPHYQQMVDSVENLRRTHQTHTQTLLANQEEIISLSQQSKEEALSELVRIRAAFQKKRKINKWLKGAIVVLSASLVIKSW